jgi:hypothetical protein
MAQKRQLCFTNISDEISWHILAQLLSRSPYFGTILPNAVAINFHKLSVQKLLCFGSKNVGETDIGCP